MIICDLHRVPLKITTLSTFSLIVKFLLSFQRSKKLYTSSFTPSKGGIFFPLSPLGGSSSSSSFDSSKNSGDFGAILGCWVFLIVLFPGFVANFFLSLGPDAFLGFCSSSIKSINSGDFGDFLGFCSSSFDLDGFGVFLVSYCTFCGG